jgi:hypothetical protein
MMFFIRPISWEVTDVKVEIVVYHDPTRQSLWIDKSKQDPQRIADFFSKKTIKTLNANDLKIFMEQALDKSNAHQKLVVFSQDVAPDTIVESNSSDNTLRRYLDAGGSVLWLGDVPLYYKSEANKEEPTPIAQYGAPTEILGLIFVYSVPKTSVSFTLLGRNIGLRTKWSGMRPVVEDKGLLALARSESLLCRYYIEIEKKAGLIRRAWNKLRTIQSFQAAQFGISFGQDRIQPSQAHSLPTHVHETHLNAWTKPFNSYYPRCGFYRIWDYPIRNLTDQKIEELFEVTHRISRRISRTSETFWMPKAKKKHVP